VQLRGGLLRSKTVTVQVRRQHVSCRIAQPGKGSQQCCSRPDCGSQSLLLCLCGFYLETLPVTHQPANEPQEAVFQPDAEQHELAGSLEQWRRAVQSSAASAALRVKAAEHQLVAAVGRWGREGGSGLHTKATRGPLAGQPSS
jgi:hypothetical protein